MIDIEDSKKEFEKVRYRQQLLYNRLTAVGMDFQFYISTSNGERKFVGIRDSILFKINGIDYHIFLLLKLFDNIQASLEYLLENKKKLSPEIPFLDSKEVRSLEYTSTQQVTILFEDIIYHIVSIYDYFASLINYIFSVTQSREQSLKWTSLAKASRDKDHIISRLKISEKIKEIDNDFVGRLYDLRSELIHRESDVCNLIFTLRSEEPSITVRPMSTGKFTKYFKELKVLSKTDNLTMRYTLFWLMNKSFDSLRIMLLALREDIIENGKSPSMRKIPNNKLILGIVNENNNFVSPSDQFWSIDDKL